MSAARRVSVWTREVLVRRVSGVRLVKLLKVIIWSGSGHLLGRMPFRRNQVSPFPSAFASIALVTTAEDGLKRAPAGRFRGAYPHQSSDRTLLRHFSFPDRGTHKAETSLPRSFGGIPIWVIDRVNSRDNSARDASRLCVANRRARASKS